MRITSLIILTSNQAETLTPDLIDRAIAFAEANKLAPILVLGRDGDDVLPTIQNLDKVEMIFDPNDMGNEFSGVKAGLHVVNGASTVWRIDSPLPTTQQILSLQSELLRCDSSIDALQTNKTLSLCAVTMSGLSRLRELPAQTPWRESESVRFHTPKSELHI